MDLEWQTFSDSFGWSEKIEIVDDKNNVESLLVVEYCSCWHKRNNIDNYIRRKRQLRNFCSDSIRPKKSALFLLENRRRQNII